jgi:opacity protein-like surface antigen
MKKLLLASLVVIAGQFAIAQAMAQTPAADCEAKAIGKNGKALAGAAKDKFMKKCTGDAAPPAAAQADCEAKALSKEGKPLHGAAKSAFMKKCVKDAQAK